MSEFNKTKEEEMHKKVSVALISALWVVGSSGQLPNWV